MSCFGGIVDRMRADRLLSLLFILTAGRQLTAGELARQLEVAPRTVLRDVQALSAAGVPVYCERGRAGGVRLMPGYKTDLAALTEPEARALIGAIASPVLDALGLGGALASALRKVTAALPAAHRAGAVGLADRLVIDPEGWLPGSQPDHLGELAAAVMADRRVIVRHTARGRARAAKRTIDPYGLVSSAGAWYLAGAHRGKTRFYAVARIDAITVLDEPARRPPGLDLRQIWAESRAEFRARLTPIDVRLRVKTAALPRLRLPAAPPGRGVWTTVTIRFDDITHAVGMLPSLKGDVEVLHPPELRAAIIADAKAVLAAHSAG
ncbi:MAG: WYL domain-containing protein [Bifidobacteriaceae bacterium]|jgi:predicted DNA-binding transcriptional regulator YafY|nr:WYL domain-containing protein [Bifidobacteriaceae bacterium]